MFGDVWFQPDGTELVGGAAGWADGEGQDSGSNRDKAGTLVRLRGIVQETMSDRLRLTEPFAVAR